MLWRALKHVKKGFYIDVGANDPKIDSVTQAFYLRGWNGINIEPVSQWFNKLQLERTNDINLQIAAGEKNKEIELFEIIDTGLSTTDKATADRHLLEKNFKYKKIVVPMKPLSEVCEAFQPPVIHFLKIDVEGCEKQVLKGFDFSKFRPWIILVEATLPMCMDLNFKDWDSILLDANYNFVYFDGLNRFYVSEEENKLSENFNSPPNVFDSFLSISESSMQLDNAQLRKELNKSKDSLQAERDAMNLLANTQQKKIDLLLASTSWRITAPLRAFNQAILWLWHLLTRAFKTYLRRPLKKAVRFIKKAIRVIFRRPLKKAIRFIFHRPKIKTSLHTTAPQDDSLSELNPYTRSIYSSLKIAIEQYKGSQD